MTDWKMEVVESHREVEGLGKEWDTLSALFQTPLLDHDWHLSAAESLHVERQLRVVTVRSHGRLAAIAPMALDQSGRHLVLIGSQVLHEPGGWVFSSESALSALTTFVVSLGSATVLDRVPAHSDLGKRLPGMLRGKAIAMVRPVGASMSVRLGVPWTTLFGGLGSRTRQKLTAIRRRAEREAGAVTITRHAPGPSEVDQHLALLMRIEAAGWKGRAGSALGTRADLAAFFRAYARRAAAAGRLRMSVLSIAGVPAAAELGIEAYKRMWGLKIGYDEQFASFAPAIQLRHDSMRVACEAGLSSYEFLGSAEPWQERWRPEKRDYVLAAWYPLKPRPLMTAVEDLATHILRRVRRGSLAAS